MNYNVEDIRKLREAVILEIAHELMKRHKTIKIDEAVNSVGLGLAEDRVRTYMQAGLMATDLQPGDETGV